MLDTIAIALPEHVFCIRYSDRFTPDSGFVTNHRYGGRSMIKCHYNPTKAEKASGYKPRLTLFRKPFTERASAVWLKIEFSAPKLVFGNNFQELAGRDDLEVVLNALHKALAVMGIIMTLDTLRQAKTSAIHYSKNILLERTTPCFLLIQALEKLDLSAKLDLNQTDFRNNGQMVKYHASSYEIALYDKVKDLERASVYGDKRGVETDYACQTDLLGQWGKRKPEVLRFEIRLTGKKLKSLLKTWRLQNECTLDGLFSPDLSRCVLLHFWEQITKGLYAQNIDTKDIVSLIASIRETFPGKRPAKVAELTGFLITCQQIGFRGAALVLGMNPAQLYRMKADIKKLEKRSLHPRFSVLGDVKSQLVEFIPLVAGDIVNSELLQERTY